MHVCIYIYTYICINVNDHCKMKTVQCSWFPLIYLILKPGCEKTIMSICAGLHQYLLFARVMVKCYLNQVAYNRMACANSGKRCGPSC